MDNWDKLRIIATVKKEHTTYTLQSVYTGEIKTGYMIKVTTPCSWNERLYRVNQRRLVFKDFRTWAIGKKTKSNNDKATSKKHGYGVCFGGSWLISGNDGDPPRTLVLENARVFVTKEQAQRAMNRAIKNNPHRNYSQAKVQKISIKYEVIENGQS